MANRLVRFNPVTAATSTPDAGAAFNKTNVLPLTGADDLGGCCIDRSENIYVTDFTKHVIYKYQKGAEASRIFAGAYGTSGSSDGQGGAARFNAPHSICVDNSGNLYVIDSGNALIRRVDQNGNVFTVGSIPAAAGEVGGICVDASGNIYFTDCTP